MGRPSENQLQVKQEFNDRWDALAIKYGDPIEGLYKLAFRCRNKNINFMALKELMTYRYSKQGLINVVEQYAEDNQLSLGWEEPGDTKPEPIELNNYEVIENGD
jgi:hypothetical protein